MRAPANTLPLKSPPWSNTLVVPMRSAWLPPPYTFCMMCPLVTVTLLPPKTYADSPSPAPNTPPWMVPVQSLPSILPPICVESPVMFTLVLPYTRPFSPPPNTVRICPLLMVTAVTSVVASVSVTDSFAVASVAVVFPVPTAPFFPPPYTSPPMVRVWVCEYTVVEVNARASKSMVALLRFKLNMSVGCILCIYLFVVIDFDVCTSTLS